MDFSGNYEIISQQFQSPLVDKVHFTSLSSWLCSIFNWLRVYPRFSYSTKHVWLYELQAAYDQWDMFNFKQCL